MADQIKENKLDGACGMHGREKKRVQVFVGKPEGRNPLGRSRSRWEDGIKMDLREIGWGEGCGVDSSGSCEGLLAGCCECGDEPSGSGATELEAHGYRL
jgi:hypothetical protein